MEGANKHDHAIPMGEEKSDARETIAASSLIDQKVAGDVDGNCVSSKCKTVDRKIRVKITKRRTEQLEKIVETNNVKENNSTATKEETIEANNSTGTNSSSNSGKGNGRELSESNAPDGETASLEKPSFKISIVPLEKLLAQPAIPRSTKNNIENKKSITSTRAVSALPPRRSRNNNASIIELSESEASDDELLVPLAVRVSSSSSSSSVKSEAKRATRNNKHLNKNKSLLSKLLIDSDSGSSEPTASEATIKLRRCVVRLKRTKLSTESTEKSVAATKVSTEKKKKSTELASKKASKTIDEAEEITKTAKEETEKAKEEKTAEEISKAQVETTEAEVEKTTNNSTTAEKAATTKTKSVDAVADKKVEKKRKMSTDSSDMEKASTSKQNRRDKKVSSNDSDSDYKEADQEEQAEAESESENDEAGKAASEAEAQSEAEAEAEDAHSSASEVMPQRKRRNFGGKKTASANDSSDFEPEEKKTKKKRRRIKKNSSNDSDDGDDEKNKNKRKHIRKIIKTKDLDLTTKEAAKEEEDRRKRIEERQKLYNRIFDKSESVEITELVLDFDEESKKALLQVDKGLLKKLKPHQVDGVKFMWDACFETIKESQKGPGSGCILAHCMGLGKTLQVVTLSHTLLINSRRTGIERVLVISPLSTVNNWAREFVHWMAFAHRKNIEVYDISRFKDKPTRIFKLNEWFEEGGVCILGYDMYRILANEKAKGLRKKQREQLQQALVEPGPDLVVCDEGHLLKNEKTSISKAVTRMRSKRRIVLTGTPLQNNLKECK